MYEYKMDANMYQGLIESIAYRVENGVWEVIKCELSGQFDESLKDLPGSRDLKRELANFVEYIIDQMADDYEVTLVKKTTFTFNMKALSEDDIYDYIGNMYDPADLENEYSMYEEDQEWEVERVRQV